MSFRSDAQRHVFLQFSSVFVFVSENFFLSLHHIQESNPTNSNICLIMTKEFYLTMPLVHSIGGGSIIFDLFGNPTVAKPVFDDYPVVVRNDRKYYVHEVTFVQPHEDYMSRCASGKCSVMDAALYYYNVFLFEHSGVPGIESDVLSAVSSGVEDCRNGMGSAKALSVIRRLFADALSSVSFRVLIPENIARMSVNDAHDNADGYNDSAIDLLNDAIAVSGIRSSEIARRTGILPCNLSLMLNGKRNPSVSQFTRVLKAIGCSMKIVRND